MASFYPSLEAHKFILSYLNYKLPKPYLRLVWPASAPVKHRSYLNSSI